MWATTNINLLVWGPLCRYIYTEKDLKYIINPAIDTLHNKHYGHRGDDSFSGQSNSKYQKGNSLVPQG